MKNISRFLLFCLWVACAMPVEPQDISFVTDDGVTIRGSWYPAGQSPAPALVLLHMNRKDRTTWNDFVPSAHDSGFSILSFDFRGHGESTESKSGELDAADFSNTDYAGLTKDLAAAVNWLKSAEPIPSKIGIAGASIGANVALVYAADYPEIAAIALISPGLDYRDIRTESEMGTYGDRPALLVAAEDDNYSVVSGRALKEIAGIQTELRLFETGGHGTYLLASRSESWNAVLTFMKTHLK